MPFMVCDLRSHASANNILSRLASLVAAELARAAHTEALCIEGWRFLFGGTRRAISACQRSMSGSISWCLGQVNAAGRPYAGFLINTIIQWDEACVIVDWGIQQ
jgi:hypothetical protein